MKVVAAIVLAATIIDAYVLYEQRQGGQPHPVPDPKSPRFPADVTAFADSPKGSWSCHYMAAFNNMMAERGKERTKYWCEKQKVNARPP